MVKTVQPPENGEAQHPGPQGREEGYRDVTMVIICATHRETWFADLDGWMTDGRSSTTSWTKVSAPWTTWTTAGLVR